MSSWQIALVAMAAFCAGAINFVAGGGTFFSFPALLAVGVPPVAANASDSVALWPASLSGAWAYRKELACHKQYLIPMGLVSLSGGVGGVMLASLAIAGHDDVHEINAIKNLLSAIIYSVTVLTFVIADAVSWPYTIIMLATASLGGYWGASVARKIPAPRLRRFIIAVGFMLTVFYFYKTTL
jgi:uncharacterized membrane protein YfcA